MSKLKLVLLRPFRPNDERYLRDNLNPHFEIVTPTDFKPATLAAAARDADAAIGLDVGPELIAAAPRLRVVQSPGAGVNGMDFALLARKGIALGSSHSNAPFVAEHAVAMTLALVKRVAAHDRLLRAGDAAGGRRDELRSDTLMGKTVGLLGFGHIAREIAARLAGFGVEIVATARRQHGDDAAGCHFVDFDKLIETSDILFICVPLTDRTRNLIDAACLARLGSEAYLVNVSRAEIVDGDALAAALEHGAIRGAALDVWRGNGDPLQDPAFAALRRLDNVILSPHRAGTHGAFAPHLPGVVENLVAYATGGRLKHEVDLQQGY